MVNIRIDSTNEAKNVSVLWPYHLFCVSMKIRARGKSTWNKFTFLNQIALDAVSLIAPAGPTFPALLDWRMHYNAIIQIFFLKIVTVAYIYWSWA